MKILFFEICNYRDYPLGGHLTFAKQMAKAMEGEMDLVGCSTDGRSPLHRWTTENIEGYDYRIFYLCLERNTTVRPVIPRRITVFCNVKRYAHLLPLDSYDCIVVQTPEVLFALPNRVLNKVCLVMPGVSNPLSISRYPFARHFTDLYNKVFFIIAGRCCCILATAGKEAIDEFEGSSKGVLCNGSVIQFPTRYDSSVFHVRDKLELRKKYGLPTADTIFITTGRLNWFKGWKFMLDAFFIYLSVNKTDNARLIFIGDGEEHANIETYVKEHGLVGKVELAGRKPLSEVAEYLALSDEFIMGSYTEGWSTSLVEAVASGLPCVVTDFSSAREMVEDGVNGFVVEDRDENIFARRMTEALKIPTTNIQEKSNAIQRLSAQNLRKDFEDVIGKCFK